VPANLPPQYYEAEEAYREASTPEEKIAALQEMLAVMPKHKGTDKLQADIKKRISNAKKEKEKKSKKTATYNPYRFEKMGAGQIILLGFPNTGKSSIVAALTNASVEVAGYPFTTSLPAAGMVPYDNIQIQLIDTPPLVPEDVPGQLIGAIQAADFPVIVISAATGRCLDQLAGTLDFLEEKRIVREEVPEGVQAFTREDLMVIATGIDASEARDNLEVVQEFFPEINIITISCTEGDNLDKLPEIFFERLGIIRIYSKAPGREPEYDSPFTMSRGSTVLDFARAVHKDFAENLEKACVWGSSKFPGQPVARDYVLQDQDIVELHA